MIGSETLENSAATVDDGNFVPSGVAYFHLDGHLREWRG